MNQGKRYLLEELNQKNQMIADLIDGHQVLEVRVRTAQGLINEQDKYLTDRQRKLVDEALANQAGPPPGRDG